MLSSSSSLLLLLFRRNQNYEPIRVVKNGDRNLMKRSFHNPVTLAHVSYHFYENCTYRKFYLLVYRTVALTSPKRFEETVNLVYFTFFASVVFCYDVGFGILPLSFSRFRVVE